MVFLRSRPDPPASGVAPGDAPLPSMPLYLGARASSEKPQSVVKGIGFSVVVEVVEAGQPLTAAKALDHA